jgi:Carbohydrate-selective porin, OprB family/S-layer homology domain
MTNDKRQGVGHNWAWHWMAIATILQLVLQSVLQVPKLAGAQSLPELTQERPPEPKPDRTNIPKPPEPVTSVDELSDVQPTDWAYQALKALIERYNLLLGYSDRTFRGNRSLTRYEFAATIDAALAELRRQTDLGQSVDTADLETIAQLQRNYYQALTELETRLDRRIEPRLEMLEAQRFSATTQLRGQVLVALTDGNAKATLVQRSQLNLTTSLTGPDLLFTQLEAGNNGGDAVSLAQNQDGDLAGNLLGTTGLFAGAGGLDYTEVSDSLRVNRLYYAFKPNDDLTLVLGAKLAPSDFIDRNRFANSAARDFNSSFFLNNPLIIQNRIDRPGGGGLALVWTPERIPMTLTALYAAGNAGNPETGGLLEDPYQGSIELEFQPHRAWLLRLQYTHAAIDGMDIDAVGLNAEWALSPLLGVFGRVGIADYDDFNSVLSREVEGHPRTWALGFNLRNFPIPGNFAGVAIGQPFISDALGDATQTNFEAFYHLQLSDNLSLSPALIVVSDADNDSDNGIIWQGVLRTVFSF